MKTAATEWDAFCFWMSGGDPLALAVHSDIAGEECRVARGYTAVLLGVLALNFICTGLSAYDVFIDLLPTLTFTGYLAAVVMPIALLWTLVVFCILRFLIQIGHDVDGDWWDRLRRLLTMLPAWCLLPFLGLVASAPLQVRALGDDIRLNSVMAHWERLSADLIEIQLAQARVSTPIHHECVTPLMRPEVIVTPVDSLAQMSECQDQIKSDGADPGQQAYSLRLLEAIRREIRNDGLIARVSLAFESAPGTSWLIALIMMSLFSAPIITRMLARKRAYEYLQYDRGRHALMDVAGIELHAHEAFDAQGKSIPLHRYRRVEAEQRLMQASYSAQAAVFNEWRKRKTETAHRRV